MTVPILQPVVSQEFVDEVRAGLTKSGQRELPSKYLYDAVGSELFEAICLLPEYGLTRADTRLLQRHATEIVSQMPFPEHVAELGSGSGKKHEQFSKRWRSSAARFTIQLKFLRRRWPLVEESSGNLIL